MIDFVSYMTKVYDVYIPKGDISTSFYTVHGWIVNFKCFYVKSKNEGKWDASLSFDAILFLERETAVQRVKKYVPFMKIVL